MSFAFVPVSSEMFDWDDQELANIIWGEGSEVDEHIVPYPEDINKRDLPCCGDNDTKKLNVKDTNNKAYEENTSRSKLFSDGCKSESNNLSASGGVMDPRPHDIASAKKTKLDIGPENSHNHPEDKELGELVGNSWANIRSFDDLDRIFSNDELDGRTNLGSSNELWPSSNDLMSEAAKSSPPAFGSTSWEFGASGRISAHLEINYEHLPYGNRSVIPSCQKTNAISSDSQANTGRRVELEEYAVGTTGLPKEKTALSITRKTASDFHLTAENNATPNKSADGENQSKCQSKHVQKIDKRSDCRRLWDIYDTWPPSGANFQQLNGQPAPTTVQNYPSLVPSQQHLPQEFTTIAYQNFSNPYVAPYASGKFTHQYPGEVITLNKPMETAGKPVNMTPQEKIEKLRRRQQMRAMLAIQKQQQQLGQKASSVDSPSHKGCQEDQVLHIEKPVFEGDECLSTLPCHDPGSPKKGDYSGTLSDIDEYSAEDTILHQLQDIIARLDMKIRLCIRDSLYRLALSSMQRHCASDTSCTNRSTYEPDIAKEEISSHDRFAGESNVEIETNHIDRAVAHLLFHRHFKFSAKQAETPESSTVTKVSIEQQTAAPSKPPVGFLAKGSKTPCPFVDSSEEDILNEISQREKRINPQIRQKIAKHSD